MGPKARAGPQRPRGHPAQLRMALLNMLVAPSGHNTRVSRMFKRIPAFGQLVPGEDQRELLLGTEDLGLPTSKNCWGAGAKLSVQGPGRWCQHPAHRLLQPSDVLRCQPFSSWPPTHLPHLEDPDSGKHVAMSSLPRPLAAQRATRG